MKRILAIVLFAALCVASVGAAQVPAAPGPTEPLSASLKVMYDGIKRNIVESAAKIPEADFAFKPTPDVRSVGEMFGHVANGNYGSCARVKGEKNPNDGNNVEKNPTKGAIEKALADSFAYCDAVYGSMTDAKALELVTPMAPSMPPAAGAKPAPPPAPKVRYLIGVISHTNEHYGNLVTYMRLKGMVPPSTERSQPMKK